MLAAMACALALSGISAASAAPRCAFIPVQGDEDGGGTRPDARGDRDPGGGERPESGSRPDSPSEDDTGPPARGQPEDPPGCLFEERSLELLV